MALELMDFFWLGWESLFIVLAAKEPRQHTSIGHSTFREEGFAGSEGWQHPYSASSDLGDPCSLQSMLLGPGTTRFVDHALAPTLSILHPPHRR